MAATTTSNGYKLPSVGDRGTWWTNLTDNWSRMNSHTHDGDDSELISTALQTKSTKALAAVDWVATAGGTYRQLVTHPTGITFPAACMTFYLTTLGHQIFPTVEKVSSTTYYVYINDNTLAVTVEYA